MLCQIWRQNAWRTLTEHHGAFAANEADLHERVTELLGDQFYSVTAAAMPTLLSLAPPHPHPYSHARPCPRSQPTLSTVNGKQLEGKSIALLFDDGSPYKSNTLKLICSHLRRHHGFGTGGKFELVMVSPADAVTAESFATAFGDFGGLAIPISHQQRRLHLRELFELKPAERALLLLDEERRVISRKGEFLFSTANSIAGLNELRKKAQQKEKQMQTKIASQRLAVQTLATALVPLRRSCFRSSKRLAGENLSSLAEYLVEPEPSPEAQAAVKAANMEVDAAKKAVSALGGALDALCATEAPSEAEREAVEGVCVILCQKAQFENAKLRLLRNAGVLARRLASFDFASVPKIAESRLRDFVSRAPFAAGEVAANALRRWVLAQLAASTAAEELRVSTELQQTSASLTSTVEALAALAGLHQAEPADLRLLLLVAQHVESVCFVVPWLAAPAMCGSGLQKRSAWLLAPK